MIVTPVPIGLGFGFWTALGLGLRVLDWGLGLDNFPQVLVGLTLNCFVKEQMYEKGYYK